MTVPETKPKILVVDDDLFTREILCDILQSHGYLVNSAENGQDGYDTFTSDPEIKLIITDINMPVMGGLELIKKLRDDNHDVPLVILTGNNEISVAMEAISSGAGDYLLKDENIQDTIILAADKALEKKRIVDQNRQLVADMQQMNRKLGKIVDKMTEIGTALSSEKDFNKLSEMIISHTRAITHADAGTLYLLADDVLNFLIIQNDTLDISMGGSSGDEIPFSPVELEESNVSAYVALNGETVNIGDVYDSELFDFTGPKKFDVATGYKSQSMLVIPMRNDENIIVGVIQLLNAKDPKSGEVISFSEDIVRLAESISSQAAVAVSNVTLIDQKEKLFEEVLNLKNYDESILESLSNGVMSLDAEGRIVKCNEASLNILHADVGSIIGMPAGDFFRGDNSWIVEKIDRVLTTGQTDVTMDSQLVLEDGGESPVNLTIAPLTNVKKDRIGSLLVFEDITGEKRLKGTLARYMTKEVSERLLESGEEILGGQIQEASVLFSDIRGFTTMAEKLGAQGTVTMLNEYFTIMVDIIFEHHGILDKYIGDAIMAAFGVPFPGENDTDNSVTAAIDMIRALGDLNRQRKADDQDMIDIGIGINTDEVLAGNIGSMKRMDYTMIGDGVNLAARLESACKFYRSQILISEHTFRKLKGNYRCREADRMTVKGKTKPVAIYEILDFHTEETFPNIDASVQRYSEALNAYRDQKWQDAIEMFSSCLSLNDQDYLPQLYTERAQYFMANPPLPDWDGVWVMTTK